MSADDRRLQQIYEAAAGGDLQELKQVASGKGSDATQAAALDLLSQLDPVSAADIALKASALPDLGERVIGLQALAHVDSPASTRALGEALNDSDTGVKRTALAGLGEQTGPEALTLISKAAADPDPTTRAVAKELLAVREAQNQSPPLLFEVPGPY